MMSPLKISAQFAAFVWYTEGKPETPKVHKAARRFARGNWKTFLPSAHKGLGRLLIKIARGRNRTDSRTKVNQPRYFDQAELASVCS
jgi:hypothetical protein